MAVRQCMITLWLHPQHSRCQLRPLLSPEYQMDRLPSLRLGAAADAVWKGPVRASQSLSIFCLHRVEGLHSGNINVLSKVPCWQIA